MEPRDRPALGQLAAGFSVWAAAFAGVYAVLSLGCALGWETVALGPVSLQRGVVVVLSLASVLACALVATRLAGGRHDRSGGAPATFIRKVAFHAALAATGAVLFTFSGVTVLSTCS